MIRRWEEETVIDSLQKQKKRWLMGKKNEWAQVFVDWLVGEVKDKKIINGISINSPEVVHID